MTRIASLLALAALSLAGCSRPAAPAYQGYLEADFVYVAAPLAGRLENLSVQKGARVEKAAVLFSLEHITEAAAQKQAQETLRSAEARVADLKKGLRPTELAALEASLAQTRAAAELSGIELARQEKLLKANVATPEEYDRARLAHTQNLSAVDNLTAQIATAQLGSRADTIAAAEAETAAAAAALVSADWSVAQKTQSASTGALVYDTLYREGEFVPAASPVVVLLPPQNMKIRFFVSETDFASLKTGQLVHVNRTGQPALDARISYLSPQPEYTPPVLYNRDNRAKLVFMIEAVFDATAARDLHPGQPVDVMPIP